MSDMMRVRIFQLADDPSIHGLFFRSYHSLEARDEEVKAENYELRYDCERPDSDNLETIYAEFNINRPADFTGHSLSMSDVVVVTRGDTTKCYYVDTVGFKEVPEFKVEKARLVAF